MRPSPGYLPLALINYSVIINNCEGKYVEPVPAFSNG
jgi:hypothetical protein